MDNLNDENERERAIERGALNNIWNKTEWGRELIVNCGDCGFVILPLIKGHTPESLVTELFFMHQFYGDKARAEECFERLRKAHVGQPASLLVIISDEQEANKIQKPAGFGPNRPTFAEVRGAVARGWCADANRAKEMDSDLAEAISVEIAKMFDVLLPPTPPTPWPGDTR